MPKTPTAPPPVAPSDALDAVALDVKLVPIDSVRPDPANVREHNDRNLASIVASLKQFGQRKAIVVDAAGVIRAGNGTWLGAKRLGWKNINVSSAPLTDAQLKLYAIADNRIGELSYFDDAALAGQMREVSADDLLAIGFDQAEVTELLEAQQDPLVSGKDGPGKSQGQGGQVSVRMLVAVSNVELVERAFAATGEMNREAALLKICQTFLEKPDGAAGQ